MKNSNCLKVINFLQNDPEHGYKPQNIADKLNIHINSVYMAKHSYPNKIISVNVAHRETYYLAKID